jgi:hypothetical protein
VLAEELPRRRVEESDMDVVPLHVDPPPDPAGRRAIEGGVHFDTAIEVHGAIAEAVVPKRLEGKRLQPRPFVGKHGGDLALGRAVNARIGPVRIPAIEIGLGGLKRLEAQALQRRALGVPDSRFDFALAIGIADAARQGDCAVVSQDIAIERVDRGIVDIRRQHAFLEVVEDDNRRRTTQPTKGAFV